MPYLAMLESHLDTVKDLKGVMHPDLNGISNPTTEEEEKWDELIDELYRLFQDANKPTGWTPPE